MNQNSPFPAFNLKLKVEFCGSCRYNLILTRFVFIVFIIYVLI